MKKYLKIALASVLMFSAPTLTSFISTTPLPIEVSAMTASQDPNGFADLYWGEPLYKIQESYETKFQRDDHSGAVNYQILIPDGSGYFPGPTVVNGTFVHDKLYGILILFRGEMFPEYLNRMTKLFGSPKERGKGGSDDYCIWDGPFTSILLSSDNNKGAIILISKV